MVNLVFSVFDEKGKFFSTPLFMPHKGLAIREFSDVARDQKSHIFKHASDYKLYCLGEFDNVSGQFLSYNQPEFLCNASDFLADLAGKDSASCQKE